MSPITIHDLHAALDTQREVFTRDLNERFEHYEQRAFLREEKLVQSFARVIENVNAHISAEITALRRDLDIREEFDQLVATLARRLDVPVGELTGRGRR